MRKKYVELKEEKDLVGKCSSDMKIVIMMMMIIIIIIIIIIIKETLK